jgi:hypothetical protein
VVKPEKPPEKWEIESGLERFLGGEDPQEVKPVAWPTRPTVRVGLRPLLADQYNEADTVARKWAEATGIPYSLDIRQDSELSHVYLSEIVARALVKPDPPHESICSCGAELRAKARPETIRELGHQLADWTKHTAPPSPTMGSPAEFERILAVLGEGLGATLLEGCEPAMLRGLLLYTVAHPRNSTGSTSSTSTPDTVPGETSPG